MSKQTDALKLESAAIRVLDAWDTTVLPKSNDGMMQERMECLREALADHIRDATKMVEQPDYRAVKTWHEGKPVYVADNALDRMAENARELGLDYEPPCKTGSQCTSKCQQCAVQEPVTCNGIPAYEGPLSAAQRQWVGTVDCIGLALDLEAQAKRVESQTVERAMLAAANGLRIIDKESKT